MERLGYTLRVSRKPDLAMRQDVAERFERGDSQVQIARDLGISPATVRYYLRLAGVPGALRLPGDPTELDTVCRMCRKS